MVGFKKYVLPTKNSVHYNNWDVSNEKVFLDRLGLGTVLTMLFRSLKRFLAHVSVTSDP